MGQSNLTLPLKAIARFAEDRSHVVAVALDELLKRQRLGVRIGVVLRRADLYDGDDSIQDILVKESLSHAVVTGAIMVQVLDALVDHGSIVAADDSGVVLWVTQLAKQSA